MHLMLREMNPKTAFVNVTIISSTSNFIVTNPNLLTEHSLKIPALSVFSSFMYLSDPKLSEATDNLWTYTDGVWLPQVSEIIWMVCIQVHLYHVQVAIHYSHIWVNVSDDRSLTYINLLILSDNFLPVLSGSTSRALKRQIRERIRTLWFMICSLYCS